MFCGNVHSKCVNFDGFVTFVFEKVSPLEVICGHFIDHLPQFSCCPYYDIIKIAAVLTNQKMST